MAGLLFLNRRSRWRFRRFFCFRFPSYFLQRGGPLPENGFLTRGRVCYCCLHGTSGRPHQLEDGWRTGRSSPERT
ncbi:hypothetical protein HMPREF3038_00774 [Akkermansia sp. KLE1797]|nr:hypothetical protein HMPREF3038_00774 [Akkermansia sp. KLE1797]KZA04963.1 hypothetical protein HMPREF1326_01545 [Akkermansia sp. KLE1605]